MSTRDSTELVISNEPQFFFDNSLLEEAQNVTRTMHSPQKDPLNPLIKCDQAWEHVVDFNSSDYQVWQDTETNQFHCIYRDLNIDSEKLARVGGTIIDWNISRFRQLYARSDDGLTWEKPPLGLVTENGKDTNILLGSEEFGNAWGFAPIEDPLEPNPNRKFKAIFFHGPPGFAVADEQPGAQMRSASSPDGVHWTVDEDQPTFGSSGSRLGDVNFPFFNPETQTYLSNTRHPLLELAPRTREPNATVLGGSPGFDPVMDTPNRRAVRRIFQSESPDLRRWSTPRLILAPDPAFDNLDDGLYGMWPLRVGNEWLGFIQVFHMVSNTSDIQLAHSRDGKNWTRLVPGKPWLTNGTRGTWDEFQIFTPRVIPHGDEMWVYYGGASCHHDWWMVGRQEGLDVEEAYDSSKVQEGLGLARLRLNGFFSIGAHRVREGMLATQPLIAAGDTLVINGACGPDGYIKVEVANVRNEVLPGKSLDQCDPFTADDTSHVVTWNGDHKIPVPSPAAASTVSGYTSRPEHRRFRFIMRDAELYTFQITDSPVTR
jgi:hypothetical protein